MGKRLGIAVALFSPGIGKSLATRQDLLPKRQFADSCARGNRIAPFDDWAGEQRWPMLVPQEGMRGAESLRYGAAGTCVTLCKVATTSRAFSSSSVCSAAAPTNRMPRSAHIFAIATPRV